MEDGLFRKGESTMKRVVIVNTGGRRLLLAEKGGYDSFVAFLKDRIEGLKEEKIIVEVVTSVEEAMKFFSRMGVLIFITLGMLNEARRIKESHPWLRVIVFTGLLPEDEVILFHKRWLSGDPVQMLVSGV
jgi:hypothetical protein